MTNSCAEEKLLQFRPYRINETIPKDFQHSKESKPLIDFFNKKAKKCVSDLISSVFVMYTSSEDYVGYVAISLTSIRKKELKGKKQKGIYDRPAMLIGQLIIDERYQGKRYGSTAVKFVISVIRILGKFLPCRLLIVNAMNDEAAKFYKKLGFEPMVDDQYTLILDLLPILKLSKNKSTV